MTFQDWLIQNGYPVTVDDQGNLSVMDPYDGGFIHDLTDLQAQYDQQQANAQPFSAANGYLALSGLNGINDQTIQQSAAARSRGLNNLSDYLNYQYGSGQLVNGPDGQYYKIDAPNYDPAQGGLVQRNPFDFGLASPDPIGNLVLSGILAAGTAGALGALPGTTSAFAAGAPVADAIPVMNPGEAINGSAGFFQGAGAAAGGAAGAAAMAPVSNAVPIMNAGQSINGSAGLIQGAGAGSALAPVRDAVPVMNPGQSINGSGGLFQGAAGAAGSGAISNAAAGLAGNAAGTASGAGSGILGSLLGGGSNAALLGAIAGGLLGSQNQAKQSGTITQIQDVPEWMKPYYQNLYNQAQQVAGNNTLNPSEQSAIDTINNLASAGSPVLQAAESNLTKTINGDYLSPDSNPYLAATFNRAASQIKNNLIPSAGFTQAFGGNSGFQQAYGRSLSDLATSLYGGQYQQERQNQMAATSAAPSFTSADFTAPMAQLQAGQYARSVPQNNVQLMGGILNGSPFKSSSQPYFTNPTAGALGGALTGGLLGKMF